MTKILFIFLWTIAVLFDKSCFGGSVLFLPPMASSSHKLAMVVWADALAERGHDVYWWAPAAKLDKYQPSKAKHVDHYEIDADDREAMDAFRFENSSFLIDMAWSKIEEIPSAEGYVNYLLIAFCENVIKQRKASLDQVLSRKYDLIIIDEFFNPCGYLVTQLLKVPVATYVSCCRTTSTSNRFNGVPIPFSYMPYLGLERVSDKMSYLERLTSTISWGISNFGNVIWFRLVTKSLRNYYPNLDLIETSMMRPSFQFVCMHKQLDIIGPTLQNVIYMGGIQIPNNVVPLNEKFRSMIDGAKKGFVLLTMGHFANWLYAPEYVIQAFLGAFTKLSSDYLVLWQYNGVPIPNLPENIKTIKWVPQRSLLAEPLCKLFITHSGCNSFNEGVYYAVPMLAVSLLGGDQYDDALKVSEMGFGIQLDKLNVTSDQLYDSMLRIIRDKRYRRNVKKMSDIIKNDISTSLEKAVFWTEFAMKHRTSSHYKSSFNAVHMSFLKYYCLDVLATFSLIIIIFIWLTLKISKFVWRMFVK